MLCPVIRLFCVLLVPLFLAGCIFGNQNQPPTANAGPDQAVDVLSEVQLDGTASFDPEGQPLRYIWSFTQNPGTAPRLMPANGVSRPTFTPEAPGTYVLSLRVDDGLLLSDPDSVTITVQGQLPVEVPDVEGETRAAAEAAIVDAGLNVGTVSLVSSDTVPAGIVISQAPAGGALLQPGSEVNLFVSSGPPPVSVPNVAGQDQITATATLEGEGLEVGTISFEESDTVPAGQVIRQDPAGGTDVPVGTAVDLVISADDGTVAVPNVVGLDVAAAEIALGLVGLNVGNLTSAFSEDVPMGAIVSQDPAAASVVAGNSEVDLVISLGAAVTVPNVAGQSQAAAETAIEDAGLTVGTVTQEASAVVPAGNVIRTNPAGGTQVAAGTDVDLVVSLGATDTEVPDVTGGTVAAAETALEAEELVLGTITQRIDGSVAPGTVIEQDPVAGTTVGTGTAVDVVVAAAAPNLQFEETFSLLELQNDPLDENVLKLFGVTGDATRNRVYVSGILTPHIAVLNSTTGLLARTIDTGLGYANSIKNLSAAPEADSLYVHETAGHTLLRIDMTTETVTATADIGTPFAPPVYDSTRGVIYLIRSAAPSLLILDATTLAEVGTSNALNGVTGDSLYVADEDRLYVLDGSAPGNTGTISLYDPEVDVIADTITFDMPGVGAQTAFELDRDTANGRLFIRTDEGLIRVATALGTSFRTISPRDIDVSRMVFDPNTEQVILLGNEPAPEGQVASKSARLLAFGAYGGNSSVPEQDIAFGMKPHNLYREDGSGRIFIPEGDASVLWSVDTGVEPWVDAFPLRIGHSVDQVVALGDGRIIGTSRLGGSYLFTLDVATGDFDTFTAGTWPLPLRTGIDRIHVLNAWDSSVSTFDTSGAPVELNTRTSTLPEGSTDRLPDLAIDHSRQRAFLAYPEFGQVAVVNLTTGLTDFTIDVAGFNTGDVGGGPGQMQVAVNEDLNRLFVLDPMRERLDLYDGENDFAPISGVDLSGDVDFAALENGLATGWLQLDADNNALFVGPVECSAAFGTPTGRTLPAGQVVIALDAVLDLYWSVERAGAADDFEETIRAHSRETLAVIETETLVGLAGPAPTFEVDTANRELYRARLQRAEVDRWRY
jgi:beta-lactam-binding protein with PASTA domain